MAAFFAASRSRTSCRCTRDSLMLNVLLQRCGLGMRIDLADVICTACHSRRRWHSLARTALAKHAAISCRQVVRHPPGGKSARPRRRRVAYTSRGDSWTAPPAPRPACHVAARLRAENCGPCISDLDRSVRGSRPIFGTRRCRIKDTDAESTTGGALGGLVSHIALVGGVLFEWRRSSSPRPPRTRGARCAGPTEKRERASNTRPLRSAPAQAGCGLALKIKFLLRGAMWCDRQQIVHTVSAAPLEPARPARPYRCAPHGIHLHALHPNFPCLFALSHYECQYHARNTSSKNVASIRPARAARSMAPPACLACSAPRPLCSGPTSYDICGTRSGILLASMKRTAIGYTCGSPIGYGGRYVKCDRDRREVTV